MTLTVVETGRQIPIEVDEDGKPVSAMALMVYNDPDKYEGMYILTTG